MAPSRSIVGIRNSLITPEYGSDPSDQQQAAAEGFGGTEISIQCLGKGFKVGDGFALPAKVSIRTHSGEWVMRLIDDHGVVGQAVSIRTHSGEWVMQHHRNPLS